MSRIPRRRSRPLKVGGEKFRWMTGSGRGALIGTSGPCLVLTVQRDEEFPGGVMRASLRSRLWTKEHTENLDNAPPHQASLMPMEVRRYVEFALDTGWDPSSRHPFVLRWSDGCPCAVDYALEGEP